MMIPHYHLYSLYLIPHQPPAMMKLRSFAATALLLPSVTALAPQFDRRVAISSAFGLAIAAVPLSTSAAASPSFEGTFSDPINHPGGTRTIKLVGEPIGDYQLAKVEGGGGRGEPASFVLPAMVIGDRAIIIDFSPKGGPRDFQGFLDEGNIKFVRDGNLWPRL
jgi:hypothetical protein